MSGLPDWLIGVKQTLPGWIEEVSHPDGPGRFRFAVDAYEPYDLDSSLLIENVLFTMGPGPDERQRRGWIDYILGHQRPEDGLMVDAAMERHILSEGDAPSGTEVANVRRFITRNALNTVIELGGTPRYRLAHEEAFNTPQQIVDYLAGLHWHNPWGAGSWAGAAVLFQHFNRLSGSSEADAIIDAAVKWLTERQDPGTGAWSDGNDVALNCLINGIFKIWIEVLPVADLPVQYPERVVDLCIRGLTESPALTGTPDACSIFDVALVLDVALRYCDHRRDEVAQLAAAALPSFGPMVRPDGAFSYGPQGSLRSHGGLALAPVKDQSDAAGTAIICSAIALLCNLCGLRDELGWAPLTEWRMGL